MNNIMQSPIRHKRRHRHKRRQRQDTGEDTDTREPHRQDKRRHRHKRRKRETFLKVQYNFINQNTSDGFTIEFAIILQLYTYM